MTPVFTMEGSAPNAFCHPEKTFMFAGRRMTIVTRSACYAGRDLRACTEVGKNKTFEVVMITLK